MNIVKVEKENLYIIPENTDKKDILKYRELSAAITKVVLLVCNEEGILVGIIPPR